MTAHPDPLDAVCREAYRTGRVVLMVPGTGPVLVRRKTYGELAVDEERTHDVDVLAGAPRRDSIGLTRPSPMPAVMQRWPARPVTPQAPAHPSPAPTHPMRLATAPAQMSEEQRFRSTEAQRRRAIATRPSG